MVLEECKGAAAPHGDNPLLVVASAGSGKTKTLAYRADGPILISIIIESRD